MITDVKARTHLMICLPYEIIYQMVHLVHLVELGRENCYHQFWPGPLQEGLRLYHRYLDHVLEKPLSLMHVCPSMKGQNQRNMPDV